MSYTLNYDSDSDCVFLRVEGEVTMDVVKKIAPAVGRMCLETGCFRLLNDMSQATINISLRKLFHNPKAMEKAGVLPTIKRALVVPPDYEDAVFLENVTRNRGHDLKVFKDIVKAKQWLMS